MINVNKKHEHPHLTYVERSCLSVIPLVEEE